jgi:hypothetical protein
MAAYTVEHISPLLQYLHLLLVKNNPHTREVANGYRSS